MSRDTTSEEIKAAKDGKKPKKKPYAKGIDWLSESIDTNVLYRVKGRQGLFMAVSRPNKSNLVRMARFMQDEAYTVNKSMLNGLGGAIIYKCNGETITLLDAFDNLQKHFKNKSTGDIDPLDKHDTMDIICPGYRPDKFKDYHAKKIVTWYNEIITAINIASN